MRTREQKGYVWKVGDWWWIRYADSIVENGVVVRKPSLASKLAPVLPEHRRLTRPPEAVRKLQQEFITKVNGNRTSPEKNVDLASFTQNVWFSHIENRNAAATVHGYRYYWDHILAPRCGQAMLRDFSTPTAQLLLET